MLDIIAHRGYWLKPSEQNTKTAFRRALAHDFGIETDLRDREQGIVISHDMSSAESMTLECFLALCSDFPDVTLALNVKADGLQNCIAHTELANPHFFFDMSVPDMLGYVKCGMTIYTRYSDLEPSPVLIHKCEGVWFDNFKNDDLDEVELLDFLEMGKNVVLVSPELHRRCEKTFWSKLKLFLQDNSNYTNQIGLCTDFPLDARSYFNG